jgi:hypothetical protein
MMPNAEHDTSSELPEDIQPPAHYCRGCGDALPQGSSARFHPECLKADKRRRIAWRRQRETQRLHTWLRRRKCPDCGASLEKLAQVNPGRSVETACEASQGGAEPLNSQERLNRPRRRNRTRRAALMRNSMSTFFSSREARHGERATGSKGIHFVPRGNLFVSMAE